MKTLPSIICCTIYYLILLLFVMVGSVSGQADIDLQAPSAKEAYGRGFNDALMCISLLNLELALEDKRITFGEMNAICRVRYRVQK